MFILQGTGIITLENGQIYQNSLQSYTDFSHDSSITYVYMNATIDLLITGAASG